MQPVELRKHPIHLGRNATAVVEPEFTAELAWYEGYGMRHGDDGVEGRLVSMHTFDASWDTWEMHPAGSEVVLCIDGVITLHQEHPDGQRTSVELRPGTFAVNAPGVWHTADVDRIATAVFITAGYGTELRPR